MRSTSLFISCIAALSSFACAELNLSEPLRSKQVLPSTFKPPQVFKNANLVRMTNLDKAYPRETINVIVENIDSKPQSEYYLPFEASLLSKIGGLEVRDKKAADKGTFKVEVVGLDTERYATIAPGTLQQTNANAALLSSTSSISPSHLHPKRSKPSQFPTRFCRH